MPDEGDASTMTEIYFAIENFATNPPSLGIATRSKSVGPTE